MSAPPTTTLALAAAQPAAPAPMFTAEQCQLIRDSFANGASDAEFAVLLEISRVRRLNPLLKQIHFVQRWDSEKGRKVWSTQVSIDGLRAIAERTGLYQGQDEPEFVENPDGSIKLCKVRVWRKDWPRPAVGVAYWSEYVQTTFDKVSGKHRATAMWSRMPHVMLSKCAESLALRKAFPEDMSGLHTSDEMAQADTVDVIDAPQTETVTQINADVRGVATAPSPVAVAELAAPAPVIDVAPATSPAPVAVPEAPPAETRLERDAIAPEPPTALEGFYARLASIELPGEAVGVWIKARPDLARVDTQLRESAWSALVRRTEEVGKMRNAKVWLKKAIAEEDARAARDAEAKS